MTQFRRQSESLSPAAGSPIAFCGISDCGISDYSGAAWLAPSPWWTLLQWTRKSSSRAAWLSAFVPITEPVLNVTSRQKLQVPWMGIPPLVSMIHNSGFAMSS